MTFATIAIAIVALVSVARGLLKRWRWLKSLQNGTDGWLWFTVDPKNKKAARIGLSEEDPDTSLPDGIVLLYKQRVVDQRTALLDVHENLGRAKIKKAWYDRESVDAYISHLKGEW